MNEKKKYEVAIFNQEVRRLVRLGERHRNLADRWADIHYIEVAASNEHEARAKIEARYPEDKGFVIEAVSLVQD